MKKSGRYRPQGIEAEHEPGSRGRVLRNLQGIRSAREMAEAETTALIEASERLTHEVRVDQRFTADDLRHVHRTWLGELYSWAGEYRSVNLSKGGLIFAAAREVPRCMAELERGPLSEHTPLRPGPLDELAHAIAVVHAELVLIHPFRDGNGRCARLIAVLMALQAGMPQLDFGVLEGRGRTAYFAGIRAAFDRDYAPLTSLFRRTLDRSLAGASKGGRR